MFRITLIDWLKPLAIALAVLLWVLLLMELDAKSGSGHSQWSSLRRGLENIDSSMKDRDQQIKELTR